jgi:hypothetical protein
VVVDLAFRTLQVYDIATGQYSILSSAGVGSGPAFKFPIGLLVYVPEPSSLVMVGIGALGLTLPLRRRARRKV